MNRTITFLLSFCAALFSCSKTTVIDPYFFGNGMEEIHIKASNKGSFPASKTFRIINAFIDANLLYLEMEYRATCAGSDNFQFIGGTLTFDEMGFAHREARLSIDKTGESCYLTKETKIVDIRELTSANQRDAEVILHIGGWRTDMTYVYIPYKKN